MNKPLLEIEDLAVRFTSREGVVDAVKRVSFTVDRGETVALVGESGSGKSVTALSILQLLPYPLASHPAGSIRLLGDEVVGAPEPRLRAIRGDRVGMIFQEPMTSLNPLHTIEKQIGETLKIHRGMGPAAARDRIRELLDLVGLPDARERLSAYPHQLSGGQRQRVMIAMALANEPDLLIADEPTTALDVTIQSQILDLLADLQARLDMAVLLITHDLNIVRRVAHRVCVMQDGELCEQGTLERVFHSPEHSYTRKLLDAEPEGTPGPVPIKAETVMQCEELRVWFPIQKGFLRRTVDHVRAVDGVSLAVRGGETVGIVGESGSGKTTLGLALLRLQSSRGPILFRGRDIQGWSNRRVRPLRREMQVVFQDPFGSLSPRMSVAQIVEEGLRVHGLGATTVEREELIVEALEEVGLDPAARHRYPHEFSGGQRQRIAIARAMVLKPRLVVLDEPTSALDRTVQKQIIELLRTLQRRHGIAYLFISHDLAVVRALAHQLIVMRRGEVVEAGDTRQVFDEPRADYTRALMAAAFAHRPLDRDGP
ncbi:MAG: ABC transporter ATP-binding protein [Gammaproteobacteria bacterium]|nr:ABC transporter ATP-binding protein [Gammaproteobacteria bacterium]